MQQYFAGACGPVVFGRSDGSFTGWHGKWWADKHGPLPGTWLHLSFNCKGSGEYGEDEMYRLLPLRSADAVATGVHGHYAGWDYAGRDILVTYTKSLTWDHEAQGWEESSEGFGHDLP